MTITRTKISAIEEIAEPDDFLLLTANPAEIAYQRKNVAGYGNAEKRSTIEIKV